MTDKTSAALAALAGDFLPSALFRACADLDGKYAADFLRSYGVQNVTHSDRGTHGLAKGLAPVLGKLVEFRLSTNSHLTFGKPEDGPISLRVMLHGWMRDGNDQTYTEAGEAEGWCVWVELQRDELAAQPRDSYGDEQDFTSLEEARAAARKLAANLRCDITEY